MTKHIVAGCRQEVTCKLTTMTGMLSTQTRTRVQMSGRNFRKGARDVVHNCILQAINR